jgi:uncharacterized protein (TIGR02145 family)
MKYILSVLTLFTLHISSTNAQDTVHVSTGWNIIGSLGSGAVSDLLVSCPPGIITSTMFEYIPRTGYRPTDTLQKGGGYWFKASEDGVIIFGGSTCSGTGGESCPGTPTVAYGGKVYNTVHIGNQCWLRENLNVGEMIDSLQDATNNGAIEKYCYSNDPANCATYGGLYQWNEAMQYSTTAGAQGICPTGWHIASAAEYQTLAATVGNNGNALKAEGQGTGGGAGTNTSGFSALLAGYRDPIDFSFYGLGLYTLFWSSTETDVPYAGYLTLFEDDSSAELSYSYKDHGVSVRCLQD